MLLIAHPERLVFAAAKVFIRIEVVIALRERGGAASSLKTTVLIDLIFGLCCRPPTSLALAKLIQRFGSLVGISLQWESGVLRGTIARPLVAKASCVWSWRHGGNPSLLFACRARIYGGMEVVY